MPPTPARASARAAIGTRVALHNMNTSSAREKRGNDDTYTSHSFNRIICTTRACNIASKSSYSNAVAEAKAGNIAITRGAQEEEAIANLINSRLQISNSGGGIVCQHSTQKFTRGRNAFKRLTLQLHCRMLHDRTQSIFCDGWKAKHGSAAQHCK